MAKPFRQQLDLEPSRAPALEVSTYFIANKDFVATINNQLVTLRKGELVHRVRQQHLVARLAGLDVLDPVSKSEEAFLGKLVCPHCKRGYGAH